jgi:drug/metabolite transporter (DMT)-like permease
VRIKNQTDFWSGVMFIVAGAAFAAGALNYSFGSSARPGPAYFPFGLGVLLALLGALVLFKAITVESADGGKIEAVPWKPMLLITFSVVLFGALLPVLGLAIALPVLILVSSLGGDEFKLKEVIVNSIILTVGSWAIFIKGLSLVIPLWPTFLGQAG